MSKSLAAATTGIINQTKRVTLHDHPRWCLSDWSQMLGLMFTKPGAHHCLIFPFLPSRVARLHMWFVFAPIDIVCLDGKGLVVALKEDFRPWTYWSSETHVSCVIELPHGTIRRTSTRTGDRVILPRPPL